MNNKFSENLINLRKQSGLRQIDLAEKISVTQRKISYWETGKIEPNLDDLIKVSDFFGISVDELLK